MSGSPDKLPCKMGMKDSPGKRASPPSRAGRLHIYTVSEDILNNDLKNYILVASMKFNPGETEQTIPDVTFF